MGSFLMSSGIYTIFNIKTGQQYIGQTNNFIIRKARHFSMLKNNRHPNKHLQSSFNIYGIKNFTFNILDIVSEDILTAQEQYWYERYKNTSVELFNCGEFVDNPSRGSHHSQMTKRLISENLKLQHISPPSRLGLGYGFCKLYCPKKHYKTSKSLIHGSNSCKECQRIKSQKWRDTH